MSRKALIFLAVLAPVTLFAGNGEIRRNPNAIKDRYIVVLKEGVTRNLPESASEIARAHAGRLGFVYSRALEGFSIEIPEGRARAIAKDPRVAYVEQDSTVLVHATQTSATWGLDRIDQRTLPLNGSFNYASTASSVTAYVIDTGVRASHSEFGGRVRSGYTAVQDGYGTTDCNGHGTHVAATLGGTTYGVAKGAKLVAVRVLDCNGEGTLSGVIAGVDWLVADHAAGTPAVANMSLGGSVAQSLDDAVVRAISDGVTFVVASGNDGADAINYSPARVADAITVNATDSADARASYSNYGSVTDVFAPGDNITSAWYTSDTATAVLSGTSMAAPHVAGVAALYLASNPAATPSTVWAAIRDSASTNQVIGAGSGSPNRLVFSELTTPTPPPVPTTPTTGQLFVNPGFESGNTGWTATSGAITNETARTPHAGSWYAWLCGYGQTRTDYVYQKVTIDPAATAATLSFALKIDTAETTSYYAYDKMRVQVFDAAGNLVSTLASFSNLNRSSSYVTRSYDLLRFKGQTITIRFYATEDSYYQTSFLVDSTAVKVTK